MSKLDGYWSTSVTYNTSIATSDNSSYYTLQPIMQPIEAAQPVVGADFSAALPSWEPPKEELGAEVANGYSGLEQLVYYPRANKDYKGNGSDNMSPGHLQCLNIKDLLARFFVSTYFHLERIPNWRTKCIGISSAMADSMAFSGSHMPIFDYDGNVKKKIKKDVAEFQEKYGLGDAWVYKTKKGYHVYFFCDQAAWEIYWQMVQESKCCHGFKGQVERNGTGVLRVSAKYTAFDIELEYILKSKNVAVVKRPLRKALIVQELISLGQQCGTHLASLYPQWARYEEDDKEWRAPPKPKGKRGSKKSKSGFSTKELSLMREEVMQAQYEQGKNEGNLFRDKSDLIKKEMAYLGKTTAALHASNETNLHVPRGDSQHGPSSTVIYRDREDRPVPTPVSWPKEAMADAQREVEAAEERANASTDIDEEGYDPECNCHSCQRHREDNGGSY
jgi:hypothetical protein